jgi:hypothetical protein
MVDKSFVSPDITMSHDIPEKKLVAVDHNATLSQPLSTFSNLEASSFCFLNWQLTVWYHVMSAVANCCGITRLKVLMNE